MSLGVPAITMALERSSATMVSSSEKSSEATAFTAALAARLAGAGAPWGVALAAGVGLSRVPERRLDREVWRWAAPDWPETSLASRASTSVAVACFRKTTSLRVFGEASVSSLAMRSSKRACSRASLIRMTWLVRSSGW